MPRYAVTPSDAGAPETVPASVFTVVRSARIARAVVARIATQMMTRSQEYGCLVMLSFLYLVPGSGIRGPAASAA